MDRTTKEIRDYYNANVKEEWNRIAGRPEFLITCRYLDRYIRPGDSVLDIGGGPGRYSLYLSEKGCDVTLLDLSEENVKFAAEQAKNSNLKLCCVSGDARTADRLFAETFDHILLMGPMYHLLEASERAKAVWAALKLLKPGGTIFISFINLYAGMIYAMKFEPDIIADPQEHAFYQAFLEIRSFAGEAFTRAYYARQDEILPFLEQFPIDRLHLLGQESISSPCEENIMGQRKELVDLWLDFCEQLCEREELLSWSEHLLYIGRKRNTE